MYPTLETERLILKPLADDDFLDMFTLFSNPDVVVTMEGEVQSDRSKYEKEFMSAVRSGGFWAIWSKKTDDFLGYFQMHHYINRNKGAVRYSQMGAALKPEYWGKGFCTEATCKVLHFTFSSIQTPWLCANAFQNNPAAARVLQKSGLRFYTTYQMKNQLYDQYRYLRTDYIKDNGVVDSSDVYNYKLPIRRSLYSVETPIRRIDSISYIKEPTSYLCGQSVIAMLAGVTVDEVIEVMQNDKGTSTPELREALSWYGLKTATKVRRKYQGGTLPDCCIFSIQLPGYGHWSLYYKGKYYDPEFGVLYVLPKKAKLCYYWEVVTQ